MLSVCMVASLCRVAQRDNLGVDLALLLAGAVALCVTLANFLALRGLHRKNLIDHEKKHEIKAATFNCRRCPKKYRLVGVR